MSLQEFIGSLKTLARPNKFKVRVISPIGTNNIVDLWCQSITLDSIRNKVNSFYYFGQKVVLPGSTEMGTITCSFILDSDHSVRDWFVQWYNKSMHKFLSDYSYGSINDIMVGKLIVIQLDEKGNNKKQIEYSGITPVEIGQLQYGMENENQVFRLDVTFEYMSVKS